MKKSFKKAVAVLLAVLMVAFSVPFTALAAPGDYTPNLELVFSPFRADNDFVTQGQTWQDYTVTAASTFDYSGLYDVPLEYDREAGTLTLDADKAATAVDTVNTNYTKPAEDYQYGVGDYFTVTGIIENIDALAIHMSQITYSDNIEPAGVYTVPGRPARTVLGSLSEAEAGGYSFTKGGTSPLYSPSKYYTNVNDVFENGYINTEKNYIEFYWAGHGDAINPTTYHDDYFCDPNTGSLLGYTYEDTAILQTFVFKIVGEGPITFDVYDPYNEKAPAAGFEGGYVCRGGDGLMIDSYTTYAPQYYTKSNLNGKDPSLIGTECPGSRKLTIFGENVNVESEADEYTVKFVNAAGETVSEAQYAEGTAASEVAVPENTAASYDDTNHYSYSWPEISDVTGDATYEEVVSSGAHEYTESVEKEPTCTEAGHTVYTCDCGYSYDEYPEATGHTPAEDRVNAKDATCTEDGYTGDVVCSVCGATIEEGTVIEKLGHQYGEYVYNNDATCTEDGTETAKCVRCDAEDTRTAVGTATGHDWGEWVVTIEPTYESEGQETRTCNNDPSHTETRTVPALKGISVTVEASDLGTATVNDNEVVADDVTINVAQNSDVTLTASAVEGAEFVGWEVNGKLVSTEATYTTKALANITYTPVFQLATADEGDSFTVVFTDKFGNVVSTQTVTSGADIVIPDVPGVAGYTPAGWSLSDDEIKALTEATTINAMYDRIVENTYTVTADGATITTPYAETEDVNTGIGYNTLVTVKADGATAWKLGDTTVAYGDTYSFYIGTDMDLTPVYDVVTATPTVAMLTVSEYESNGLTGASFLATREMTEDCTYVSAGFVYAKTADNENITLADVDGTTVKAAYCATEVEQFALNYGLTAQSGSIVARAFLAYVDAEGATQVVYSAPQTYTYA